MAVLLHAFFYSAGIVAKQDVIFAVQTEEVHGSPPIEGRRRLRSSFLND